MRYWEIDSLRGTAIIMMIIYHLLFDLNYFGSLKINPNSGLLWFVGRSAAITFILLVGVCLSISFAKAEKKLNKKQLFAKYFKRGIKVFSWGLLISLITWLFLKEGFIRFGILHFIGLSIILACPFLRFKKINLFAGFFTILFGLYIYNQAFDFSWLLWLGLKPYNFYTFDYFPVLPWFGIILIGLFLGKHFYSDIKRKNILPDLSKIILIRFLSFLGRNSLIIYLLHQPILIAFLHLFVL